MKDRKPYVSITEPGTASFTRKSSKGVEHLYPISEANPRRRTINMNRRERKAFSISSRQQRKFKRWFKESQAQEVAIA